MQFISSLEFFIDSHYNNVPPSRIVFETLGGILFLWILNMVLFNFKSIFMKIFIIIFGGLKTLPVVQNILNKEKMSLRKKVKEMLKSNQEWITRIPANPLSHEEILSRMRELKEKDEQIWKSGKVSGAVYTDDAQHLSLLNEVYSYFSLSNPLHPDVFPSVGKFESEIIRMTATLVNGDEHVCGAMTSGGTESILMAVKAYRDFYKKRNPEMVIPDTAHAAFDKAGEYFGVKVVRIAVDRDMRAVPNAIRKAINRHTILLAGSAPQFPHGSVDPIGELASIAQEAGIGFHSDCCLGGFLLPWLKKDGLIYRYHSYSTLLYSDCWIELLNSEFIAFLVFYPIDKMH